VIASYISAAAVLLLAAAVLRWSVHLISGRCKPFDLRAAVNDGHGPWSNAYEAEIERGMDWFAGVKKEEVHIVSRDGLSLYGDFIAHPNPRGTFLLMHGYHSNSQVDFSVGFSYYYSLGLNLLAVDQRSHFRSEGRHITYGIRERFDCVDWAAFLTEKTGGLPVILGGISMGAATVLMASGSGLPETVKGIVADCGFTSPWDIIGKVMRQRYHLPLFLLYPLSGLSKLFCGFGYREYSTLEAMKVNRIPILFVHGKADRYVPWEMTQRAFDACRAPKELLLVEGANHALSYLKETGRYQATIKAFFNKQLDGTDFSML